MENHYGTLLTESLLLNSLQIWQIEGLHKTKWTLTRKYQGTKLLTLHKNIWKTFLSSYLNLLLPNNTGSHFLYLWLFRADQASCHKEKGKAFQPERNCYCEEFYCNYRILNMKEKALPDLLFVAFPWRNFWHCKVANIKNISISKPQTFYWFTLSDFPIVLGINIFLKLPCWFFDFIRSPQE